MRSFPFPLLLLLALSNQNVAFALETNDNVKHLRSAWVKNLAFKIRHPIRSIKAMKKKRRALPEQHSPIDVLPDELKLHMLGYLDEKAMGMQRQVSRAWLSLISDEKLMMNLPNGVKIRKEYEEKWVLAQELKSRKYKGWKTIKFNDLVLEMRHFREEKHSSKARILDIIARKEEIKVALLERLSQQWQEGLPELIADRQGAPTWSPAKALRKASMADASCQTA